MKQMFVAHGMHLRADGTFKPVFAKNGKDFSLEELQGYVGGSIEIVGSTEDGMIMVINEEGKLNDLPVNERATKLYQFGEHDCIVGDALICNAKLVR